jgi:penicillin-binding protein 1A
VKVFLAALIAVPLVLAGSIYGLFMIWGDRLPVPKTMDEVQLSARSIVYDRKGNVVGSYFVEDRLPITLAEIPRHLVEAVIASEDRRFYEHWGVNLAAIGRAALRNVRAGGVTQGASTITQQLARNLFLDQSRTVERKLKEMVLAVRLERSFSKDEILELYLNRIYFGEGAYGVQAAAHRYFGKDVSSLSIGEAALIAGIPANPTLFSPIRHPEAATRRRNRVLRAMYDEGNITRVDLERFTEEELGVHSGGTPSGGAPYFMEYLRLQLAERYGQKGVYQDGLRIYSTLDLDLQHAAEKAVDGGTRGIEEDHVYRDTFESFQRAAHSEEEKTPYLQAALIALDPQTGAILAMVGGRAWQDSRFNRATQALRQPGSAFKPFIFALALRDGARTNDIIVDEPVTYPVGNNAALGTWSPKNFKNTFDGPMTLRHALALSINIPSVKLLNRIGPDRLVDFVRPFGMESTIPPYLSVALGTAEVTPIEIASAYGTFANQGIHLTPRGIERVEDRLGRVLETGRSATGEALDERTCALVVSLLRSVVERGTAAVARSKMGFTSPSAGKTGTTDDYTDAWFIGFVPRCVCAVWVGFDEKKTLGERMTGAKAALPIWVDFMKAVVAQNGEEEFPMPAGLIPVTTCAATGLMAGSTCRPVPDLFLPGTEPHQVCTGIHDLGIEPEEAVPPAEEGF